MRPEHLFFSPGSPGEAQLNKHAVLSRSACLGVKLQVAKSAAKCSYGHALRQSRGSERVGKIYRDKIMIGALFVLELEGPGFYRG